jgi:hypothetical protein
MNTPFDLSTSETAWASSWLPGLAPWSTIKAWNRKARDKEVFELVHNEANAIESTPPLIARPE